MKFCTRLVFFIVTLLGLLSAEAQHNIRDERESATLEELIKHNRQLLLINPDKAFQDIEALLKRAIEERDRDSELILLSRRCWYYTNKDLKKAIDASQELKSKAKDYNSVHYQATAHVHFSNIYLISELPVKALEQSELAIRLLSDPRYRADSQEYLDLKVNAYSAAGGAYIDMDKPRNAANMLLIAGKDISKLKNSVDKKLLSRLNYTNLGQVYSGIDADSAEYFVSSSLQLSNKADKPDLVQFNNYLLLGDLNKKKRNYAQAIHYYKRAEGAVTYINPTFENVNTIYGNLAEIYKITDSLAQANHYLEKLQDSSLKQEKNKNSSLHKIINDKLLEEKNYSIYIGLGSGVLLILSLGIMLRLHLKNKLLEKQEKADEEYLKVNDLAKLQDIDSYRELAELARNNDSAFIIAFHDQFPDFYAKLRTINPKLVESEIKFCAFLKLKLSTKEIAQIQSIEPATVKNKKNRIRKRLIIPPDVELYYFFNQL